MDIEIYRETQQRYTSSTLIAQCAKFGTDFISTLIPRRYFKYFFRVLCAKIPQKKHSIEIPNFMHLRITIKPALSNNFIVKNGIFKFDRITHVILKLHILYIKTNFLFLKTSRILMVKISPTTYSHNLTLS